MPISTRSGARSRRMTPRWFRSRLARILGDSRFVLMPQPNDTTIILSKEGSVGQIGTPDATVAARLSQLGRGTALSFASASTQYIVYPDANGLSFGTGAADGPFSGVVLANVTDTAAARRFFGKWEGVTLEYYFAISAADTLIFLTTDQSAGVSPSRASDAVITQGSWHLFGFSYDGSGGATNMNGVTLYQDGAVIASTAANSGTYVAMENLTGTLEIGSVATHTNGLFDGSMALIALAAKNLTTADHAAISSLCKQFYGKP